MSVIRTSISLISFGFTIYQFFAKLKDSNVLTAAAATRNFGQSLVWLGIGMLVVGIIYHLLFMKGLRQEREAMRTVGLIHAESQFPPSMTLVVALLMLAIGIVAILSITFHVGPFG